MASKGNENQTVATGASVDDYIDALERSEQRDDARTLVGIMSEVTGEPAAMWGPAIVGFGSDHWRYESGREGDSPRVAFSMRTGKIALYLTNDASQYAEELAAMGRTRSSKACIYVRRLSDVDLDALTDLVRRTASVAGGAC